MVQQRKATPDLLHATVLPTETVYKYYYIVGSIYTLPDLQNGFATLINFFFKSLTEYMKQRRVVY